MIRPLFSSIPLGIKTDAFYAPVFFCLVPEGTTLYLYLEGLPVENKTFQEGRSFNRKVIGRTKEALRALNIQFAQEHAEDSDDMLLEYVRQEAVRFGFTPNAGEIIGGAYISSRFGGWKHVIAAAGLPSPKRQRPITSRKIFQDEFERQTQLYARELRDQEAEEHPEKAGKP